MVKRSVAVGMGVLACAMFCGWASAAVIVWNMGEQLNDAGKQTWAMTKVGDGYGDVGAGDFNPPTNAGINSTVQGPYTAFSRFVDSGSYGNDGFVVQNGVQGTIGQTFTIDMIVRGERALNSNGRSMGLRVGNAGATKSTGVGIEPGTVFNPAFDGNALWMTCRSGAYIPHGALFLKTTDAFEWRAVRITANGDGTVTLYDFLYGAAGYVGTVPEGGKWTNLPGGGAGAELTALGFHLNTLSGGTVTWSGFSLLGLALNTDTALDGTAPFMLPAIPEPASLLLFAVLGGLTLIRGRR